MHSEAKGRLLRLPQVKKLFPVCTTTIYKLIREGEFPRPVKIGRNSFWREKEVEDFLESV